MGPYVIKYCDPLFSDRPGLCSSPGLFSRAVPNARRQPCAPPRIVPAALTFPRPVPLESRCGESGGEGPRTEGGPAILLGAPTSPEERRDKTS